MRQRRVAARTGLGVQRLKGSRPTLIPSVPPFPYSLIPVLKIAAEASGRRVPRVLLTWPRRYVSIFNYDPMNSFPPPTPVLSAVQVHRTTSDFVRRVRATQVDDLGQPIVRFISPRGGEPLRDLLRRAHPGEEVLLASYALFAEAGPFREFGPVYVSASAAPETSPLDPFTGDYFGAELILRAYDHRPWIQQAKRVSKNEAPDQIEEWLKDSSIRFVDARFPLYGCFACRFIRR